ncbi:MAG: N-acyl homoserine lactonase family protein [Pseudolysinimonas sp.]
MQIDVLSTGTVNIRPQHRLRNGSPMLWWLFTSRRWTQDFPINVYVIRHGDEVVLFDAGQDRRSVTDPHYFPRGFAGLAYRRLARFTIGADDTVPAQLHALGIAPEQVSTVVISHLHQDHIGAIGQLPGARLVASRTELDRLDRPGAELAGFLVRHLRDPGFDWQPTDVDEPLGDELQPFTHGHDLFGDGSCILLPLPGHTPGSLGALVRPNDGPPILLVGDLTYDVELLEHEHLPGVGPRAVILDSTQKVNELCRRMPGLVVLAAHDPGAASALRLAREQAIMGS